MIKYKIWNRKKITANTTIPMFLNRIEKPKQKYKHGKDLDHPATMTHIYKRKLTHGWLALTRYGRYSYYRY